MLRTAGGMAKAQALRRNTRELNCGLQQAFSPTGHILRQFKTKQKLLRRLTRAHSDLLIAAMASLTKRIDEGPRSALPKLNKTVDENTTETMARQTQH
jgi:hypothetical protein